MLNKGIL